MKRKLKDTESTNESGSSDNIYRQVSLPARGEREAEDRIPYAVPSAPPNRSRAPYNSMPPIHLCGVTWRARRVLGHCLRMTDRCPYLRYTVATPPDEPTTIHHYCVRATPTLASDELGLPRSAAPFFVRP